MCGCGCVGVCRHVCVHACVFVCVITAISPALVFTIILFQMKIEMHLTGKPQHVCLSFSFTMQIPFNIQSTSFNYLCCGRLLKESSVLGNSVWTLLNT